jgi:hypothetical protein
LGGITKPQTPDSPVTSVNADGSVSIKWTAPSSRGTLITAYTISIQKIEGSYSSDMVNCDGSSSDIVLSTSCTIPVSILKAEPFNLPWGYSIVATVTATNVVGSSDASSPGNGAVILSPLFIIPNQSLNAVINEESTLMLSIIPDVKYVVTSKPKFDVSVEGN